jgi:hypothetical protein
MDKSDDPDLHIAYEAYTTGVPIRSLCQDEAQYKRVQRRVEHIKNGTQLQHGRPMYVTDGFDEYVDALFAEAESLGCTISVLKLKAVMSRWYRERIQSMPAEQRQKYPLDISPTYIQRRLKQLGYVPVKGLYSKDHSKSFQRMELFSIAQWFEDKYTEDLLASIPPELIINIDETSSKIENTYVTATITINAKGDSFPPYILIPESDDLSDRVQGIMDNGDIFIGQSRNGAMASDNFGEFADLLIWYVNIL